MVSLVMRAPSRCCDGYERYPNADAGQPLLFVLHRSRNLIHQIEKSLKSPRAAPISRVNAALHNDRVTQMVALIEKILDAMFAPLAREFERLPPQAMRFHVWF
jgi:hypothetical protein